MKDIRHGKAPVTVPIHLPPASCFRNHRLCGNRHTARQRRHQARGEIARNEVRDQSADWRESDLLSDRTREDYVVRLAEAKGVTVARFE